MLPQEEANEQTAKLIHTEEEPMIMAHSQNFFEYG